jgi:plasmid stabilization system protein ParE
VSEPRLFGSRRAKNDLLGIARFIGADNPAAARAWVEKLREQARRVASTPRAGRRVPEVGREELRIQADGVVVLTVFESHRLFPRDLPLGED